MNDGLNEVFNTVHSIGGIFDRQVRGGLCP